MSNPTHRKNLARRLAATTGLSYQQARHQVDAAAAQGLLPSRLDEAGIAAALRVLTTPSAAEPTDGYDPYADGCDHCGGEDHTCDTCPEFTSVTDYQVHVRESHGDSGSDPADAKPRVLHLLTGTGGVGRTRCGISITQENLADTPYTINPDEVTCPACKAGDAGDPAYPNGRCPACGFGLDEQGRCYNADCSAFDATSPYAPCAEGTEGDARERMVAQVADTIRDHLGIDTAPDEQGRFPFQYRYVAYFQHADVAWFAEHRGLGPEAAKGAVIDEILGYCAPLSPRIIGTVEEVAFRGTDLENYASAPDEITDTCFRLVFGGTVRATHSDPAATGSQADYATSAQGVVEENSWENGAAHGWGYGFAVFLDIDEPGHLPPAHRPTAE